MQQSSCFTFQGLALRVSACLTVSVMKFGPVIVKFDMSVSCTKAELCMCEGYLGLLALQDDGRLF